MRDDRERLQDILDAIDGINRYAVRGREAFEQDELIQTWILHHLQIVGEAARALSSEVREQNPQVPWPEVIAMRNVLAHRYFGIDHSIVWAAVTDHLPTLREQIHNILRTF